MSDGRTFTVRLCPQIQEGMVVYVCFLQGATDDIIHDMGETPFYFPLCCLQSPEVAFAVNWE